jgi:hypothetical protein
LIWLGTLAIPFATFVPRAVAREGGGSVVLGVPAIMGPGAVTRVSHVRLKVTNAGVLGNPFTNLSSDPSGMWPDSSGVEYLNAIVLAVGAKDPSASGVPSHRVSYFREWGPPTSDAADRMYRTWETQPNGGPFVDDDGDVDPVTSNPLIDEDFLDGRDNDGDGLIDEDFGALGHETYTCVMRDDGPYSVPNGGEPHVPLGLECRQMAWDYGASGLDDFVAARYQIFNRSGHTLDSVYVGFFLDMDAGPRAIANYFSDDRDLPGYPSGEFLRVLAPSELQRQFPHSPALPDVPADSALCPRVLVRVNGFSLVDDNGDGGQTPGVASFLLIDHTVDPLGISAPQRVGFRAFRSFLAGTPYSLGGNPNSDSLRYEFMSGTEHVDPATGFVTAFPGAAPGDYAEWCSVGPFLNVGDRGSVEVTIAFAVRPGNFAEGLAYPADYAAYQAGTMGSAALFAAHPALDQAYTIQKGRDGIYEHRQGPLVPSFHGRETALRLPPGAPPIFMLDCRTQGARLVDDRHEEWFDFDCDYCTGAWDAATQTGLFHRIWNVSTALLDAPEVSARAGAAGLRIVALGPNPTRGVASLSFVLSAGARTEVAVFDLAGRVVRRVLDAQFAAGPHEVAWDGRDAGGARVAPGVYVWRVRSGEREAVSKLVRLE